MWRKIFSKEFWANVFAYVIVLAILFAVGQSAWHSWQKDRQMRKYLIETETRAQKLLADGCEYGLDLRLQIEQTWSDRPISPFSDKLRIGIVLCQDEDELKPPEYFDMDPRHYIGLGKHKKDFYLVLWNRDGKVKLKRKLHN
jgi:hypothetical protein